MESTPQKKAARTGGVLRAYGKVLRDYPLLVSLVVIGAIIIQAASLAAPLFLRQFFNLLVTGAPSDATVHAIVAALGFVALMWFIEWAAQRLQGMSNEHLEVRVMERLYNGSFSYLLKHSYNFFISNFAGSLTHKVSRYARAFETLFDSIMTQFFPTFLFISGAVVVLFLRNHTLGVILAVWTVLFMGFQIYISRVRQPIRAARAEADTRLTGALADAVSNQNTIALFSGGAHEERRFAASVREWRAATLRSWVSDGWVWGSLGLFMMVI